MPELIHTVDGPPITEQVSDIFKHYAGGSLPTAIMLTRNGPEVSFDDGSRYLFVAVSADHCLVHRPDGGLAVIPAVEDRDEAR